MIEFVPTDIAHGGEAVGRVDGKAHFVDGAMPGERIRGEVVRSKKSWSRVELRAVIDPSPERVSPRCPHVPDCGGCQWQHADYPAQLRWKQSILVGQLRHLGRIGDPPVRPTVAPGAPFGYRNRMDFTVVDGRPGLHRRRSRDGVALDVCHLLSAPLEALFGRLGDLGGARAVTLRASGTTGETLAVVAGNLPSGIEEWGSSVVHRTGRSVETVVGRGWITETVADVEFRISADAFFQNNTAGAEALIALVTEAAALVPDDTLIDAYAGGGLFAMTVGRAAKRIIAIESDEPGLSDLRHNAGGTRCQVVPGRVEEAGGAIGDAWNVAIVDPPRRGLGAEGVAAITAGEPRAIAYVSCDPASFARDTALLSGAGFTLEWVAPVDLFAQTFHVECVARFVAG